jgi:hypothetical protein
MLRTILFATAALIQGALAADRPVREITYALARNCPQGGCRAPSFDKGYLFEEKDYVNAPLDGFTVFNPEGMLAYQVNITAPGWHARTFDSARRRVGNRYRWRGSGTHFIRRIWRAWPREGWGNRGARPEWKTDSVRRYRTFST